MYSDPFPFDALQPETKRHSHAALEMLRPFLTKADGILAAMKAGKVSDHDRVAIDRAITAIREHRDVNPMDFFGEREGGAQRTLRIMCEKYASTADAGEPFAKATMRPDEDPEFKVGQRVKCKASGKKGRIVKLDYGVAHLENEDGTTGISTCGTLEACVA